MTEIVPTAEAINAEHRACEEAAVSAVQHGINAGGMLERVKASLKHGEWVPWLRGNFAPEKTPQSRERVAQTYMKLYRRRDELNPKHDSDLSIRGALRELEPPKRRNREDREVGPLEIDEIKVRRRVRKDMGNLEGLAASMAKVGILHPVVIDERRVLIDGERRIEAAKLLGWAEIETYTVECAGDPLKRLRAEAAANTWKPLAPSEALNLAAEIEEEEE